MAYYYKAGVIVPFVQKFYKQMIVVVATLFMASMATMTFSANAAQVVIYDSIPTPLPPNLASVGHEAYSAKEIGNRISFAGTGRDVTKVEIGMSSWACESGQWNLGTCATTLGATFTHPITLNIYNVASDGGIGTVIGSVTETFEMPYRPSADSTCTDTKQWKDAVSNNCYNGKAFNIEFDITSLPDMPNEIIYGVAYNTKSHGYSPTGVSGPYDSLNVALNTVAPYTGSDVTPGTIFWNTSAVFGGNGTFSLNEDWGTYTVAARFTALKSVVNYPAAPAVATNLLKEAGESARYGKGKTGGNHIADVAKEMGAGTDFRGIPKDEGNAYRCAIVDFLRTKTNPAELPANGDECYKLVDSVDVPADRSEATLSEMVFDPTKDYKLVASGVADAGDTIDFDAICSITKRISGDTWTDNVTGYPTYPATLLELKVNGTFDNWGNECNDDHEYTKMLSEFSGQASFLIDDAFYPNNIGSLTVDIYESVY